MERHVQAAGGGTLSFGWGGRTLIDGNGRCSGATGSQFGNMAGSIRAQEMAAGRIDHALFMVVNCDSGGFVYPAGKSGRACATPRARRRWARAFSWT